MNERNELIAIIVLGFLGGIALWRGQSELASVVVGAIAGYLSHALLNPGEGASDGLRGS